MTNQYENLLSKARVAYANKRYEEAIKLAKTIIQFNKTKSEAYIIAGNAYLLLNNLVNAKEMYQQAIVLDNTNGEYYFLLGNVYLGEADYTLVIESYAKAEAYGVSDDIKQKIYYVLGNINQVHGQDQEALLNYQKAGEIKGNNDQRIDILLNQLEIYVNQNDFIEAEITARSLKMIAPDVYNHYHLLFQILLQLNKMVDALEILNEAKVLFKEHKDIIEITFDEILFNVHQVSLTHQDKYYYQAIELLDSIKPLDIEKDIAYEKAITKAEILLRLKKIDEAIEVLETIADLEDEVFVNYIERARLDLMNAYIEVKKYKGAIIYAIQLKRSDDLNIRHIAHYYEAYATLEMSKKETSFKKDVDKLYRQVIAYFRNASASDPNDLVALVYRAKAYCDVGQFEKAEKLGHILPEEAQRLVDKYILENGGVVS